MKNRMKNEAINCRELSPYRIRQLITLAYGKDSEHFPCVEKLYNRLADIDKTDWTLYSSTDRKFGYRFFNRGWKYSRNVGVAMFGITYTVYLFLNYESDVEIGIVKYRKVRGKIITPCPHGKETTINSPRCIMCEHYRGNKEKGKIYCEKEQKK